MPKKLSKGHSAIIHPWEVFDVSGLAERLKCSEATIRKFISDGLKHRKMKSITIFTGQQVLNYFNQESCTYSEKVVNKVLETTGVRLA